MANFFQPRKRQTRISLIQVDEEPTNPPPTKKKYPNCVQTNGFNDKSVNEGSNSMKGGIRHGDETFGA